MFLNDVTGASGYCSFCLWLNNFKKYLQFVFTIIYLHVYISIYQNAVLWMDHKQYFSIVSTVPEDGK
jgi:hypothetical protein